MEQTISCNGSSENKKDITLADNESDKACENRDTVQVKSDRVMPSNADVNIDCAKKVQGKCDAESDVFQETLVKPNFVTEKTQELKN
jgi:hypothetical protein